jgi:hypothetical protein
MECSAARARMCAWPTVSVQGLELLAAVLLARNRQRSPTVAAGAPPAEFAAELISLPSGLLAMVCTAIVKLKVRLGAACVHVCVRACVRAFVRAVRLPGASGGR